MDNWDFMKENLDTAYNATGALQEQADIFAESWEAARKRVKTSTEGLASSLIDEDFWIDATKGLSVFIDELKLVVDSIGGLRGVIALSVVAMNKLVGPKIAQNIRDLAFNIGVLTGKEREHTQALKQSALQVIESYAKSKGNFALDQNQVLFYKDMGNYQLKVNELMKGFTSEQEEAVKNQLALVKATQDLAIAMTQSHEQARNNSDDFLVGSEDALTPSPFVHWTEQIGGRTFLNVERNRWSNGNDFLRGVEENAAQREVLTGASQLMKTGKWKDNKQQLLTMLGMDAKTTKKDF